MRASADEQRCLALSIYFEARGEPLAGQVAVAQVVLNRVRSPDFPSTICGVVKQGKGRVCQFSWWCDKASNQPKDGPVWRDALWLASYMIRTYPGDPDGALFFHARYVKPSWRLKMKQVAEYGDHLFYAE